MIVVDASVVAKWIIHTEVRAEKALALLTHALDNQETIHAPPLLAFEITNVVRQRMVREGLELHVAHGLIRQFLALPITFSEPPYYHEAALTLSDAHQLPAAYDAHYLALAQQLSCPFWTDDQRLLRLTSGSLPFVRALDTYPTSV